MEASRSGETASIDEEEEESWSGVARALESCFMPAILEAAMVVNSLRWSTELRQSCGGCCITTDKIDAFLTAAYSFCLALVPTCLHVYIDYYDMHCQKEYIYQKSDYLSIPGQLMRSLNDMGLIQVRETQNAYSRQTAQRLTSIQCDLSSCKESFGTIAPFCIITFVPHLPSNVPSS